MEHKIYQAREIMEALEISRPTFDYSAQKVGITADIKKACGPGTHNLYSFKALLSFAFAQGVLNIGFAHTPTTKILNHLYKIDEQENLGIFNYDTSFTGKIRVKAVFNTGAVWLALGDGLGLGTELGSKQICINIKGSSGIFVKKVNEKFVDIKPHSYAMVNLEQIKKDLIEKLEK